MSEPRLLDYLDHLLEAARLAGSYVDGMDEPGFVADTRTQQAVIMNLVIIGEVAAKLLKDHAPFLNTHPEVPWKSMRGMRNRIAHCYFEIDLRIVWQTVQASLPILLTQLPAIREEAASLKGPGSP
jgi:uncharacterized protein with HEPN domain